MNNLSNRQREVADLVSKGLSNKEVASQLLITEKTVKFHLTNIFKLLNVKNRVQLSWFQYKFQYKITNLQEDVTNNSDLLIPVFENGKSLVNDTLENIKARMDK